MHETACKSLILLYNIIRKWEKVGMIYFGTYQHSLDAKNRLLIPSKLKALLTSTVYIMKGFDGCLSVFDHNSFQNYVEKLQKYSFNHSKEREFIRTILSSVVEMEADKVGRIQLPTSTVKKYNISKDVVVVGVGDHVEIWNLDKWNEYIEKSDATLEDIAEEIDRV